MASEEFQQEKAATDNGDAVDFTFSMPVEFLRINWKEHFVGGDLMDFKLCEASKPNSSLNASIEKEGSFENDGCRCCCVNFNCVAVFCECFRAGEYCAKGCLDCRNNPANEDMIHDLRQRKESFIPLSVRQMLVQHATRSTQNSGVRNFDKSGELKEKLKDIDINKEG